MRKYLLGVIAVLASALILVRIVMPIYVFKNSYLYARFGSLFDYLSLQPGDLYDRKIGSAIDLSKMGDTNSSVFVCNYYGEYHLGVYFENPPRNSWRNRIKHSGLKLELTVNTSSGMTVYNFEQNSLGTWAERDGTWNMVSIDCPKDVALGHAITCVCKVLSEDDSLSRLYGPTKVYMQRGVGF